MPSVQPVHAIDDMETAERVLGDRASRVYSFQTLAQSGALLALGSDAPVADPSPFLGMHAAVCRQRPGQSRLSQFADTLSDLMAAASSRMRPGVTGAARSGS